MSPEKEPPYFSTDFTLACDRHQGAMLYGVFRNEAQYQWLFRGADAQRDQDRNGERPDLVPGLPSQGGRRRRLAGRPRRLLLLLAHTTSQLIPKAAQW